MLLIHAFLQSIWHSPFSMISKNHEKAKISLLGTRKKHFTRYLSYVLNIGNDVNWMTNYSLRTYLFWRNRILQLHPTVSQWWPCLSRGALPLLRTRSRPFRCALHLRDSFRERGLKKRCRFLNRQAHWVWCKAVTMKKNSEVSIFVRKRELYVGRKFWNAKQHTFAGQRGRE